MKLAILLMIHNNLQQVKMLINTLSHPNITIFVHADKKMDLNQADLDIPGVILLPEEKRVNVKWGTISMVDAILNIMEYAIRYGDYDYYWLCSGQDFPLVKANEIVSFFKNKTSNFIEFWKSYNYGLGKKNNLDKRCEIWCPNWVIGSKLHLRILKRLYIEITGGYFHTWHIFKRKNFPVKDFYFGATWWCLNRDVVLWMVKYLAKHWEYRDFYKNSICPDESFFHTLIKISPYADNVESYLHYIDWSQGGNHPKILTCRDYQLMKESGKLMARKFDINVDAKVLDMIQNNSSKNE